MSNLHNFVLKRLSLHILQYANNFAADGFSTSATTRLALNEIALHSNLDLAQLNRTSMYKAVQVTCLRDNPIKTDKLHTVGSEFPGEPVNPFAPADLQESMWILVNTVCNTLFEIEEESKDSCTILCLESK